MIIHLKLVPTKEWQKTNLIGYCTPTLPQWIELCIYMNYYIQMHKELLRHRDELLSDLRQFISHNNLSQSELSRRSGVCQPQISRILNAKSCLSKQPSRKLVELCNSLNIKTRNALYDPSEDDQLMTLLRRALGQSHERLDRVKRVLKALAED